MQDLELFATTVIGTQHRFWGLDWSYLSILGFMGSAMFGTRFLLQWLASEKRGESVIPLAFWYWSIAGSLIMGLYFIFRRDPVGIVAYVPNALIYFRNLQLIRNRKRAATAAVPFLNPKSETV